jgi:AcrR family transcriptional regulator
MPTSTSSNPKPVRRTQEERSASMERALLDSATSCILEFGVAGSPVNLIAQRANATGGALQHHFGTRDALLLRLVKDFGDHLEAVTQASIATATSIEERVDQICDASWQILSSPQYLVVMQILLSARNNEQLHQQLFDSLQNYEATLDAYWVQIFKGSGITRTRIATVRHLAMATFRGLALRMLYQSTHSEMPPEIALLKAMVCRELQKKA